MNTATKKTFYSQGGWAGDNYNRDMSVKEIAATMRTELKKLFPKVKFSITSTYNTLDIYMTAAPFQAITDERTNIQVNHYYLENHDFISEEARAIMKTVKGLAQSYNYDDSDSMTDYFDTNFYLHIGIGKWDKPFINTAA